MASAEFLALSVVAASSLEVPSEQRAVDVDRPMRCAQAVYEIKNTFVEVQEPSIAQSASRSTSAPPTVRFRTTSVAGVADRHVDVPLVPPSQSSSRCGSKCSSGAWSTTATPEQDGQAEIDSMMDSASGSSRDFDVAPQQEDCPGDRFRVGATCAGRAKQSISQCNAVADCDWADTSSWADSPRSPSRQRPQPIRDTLRALFASKFATVSEALKMAKGSPKYYSALINECIKASRPEKAVWCADEMSRLGIPPNIIHFNKVLHACAKSGNYNLASQWWTRLDTLELVPTNVSYNTMINACAQARRPKDAEAMLQEMISKGLHPCQLSFTAVVVAFASRGDEARAEKWLMHMRSMGLKGDAVVYNAFFNACAKAGALQKARQWVHRMTEDGLTPNVRTYNSLIHACAKFGNVAEAAELFEEMKALGLRADLVTFGSLIDTCAKAGNTAEADIWMNAIYAEGLRPNMVCFNSILIACAVAGDVTRAEYWFARLKRTRIPAAGATYNSMLAAFAVSGDEQGMRKLLADMTSKKLRPDTATVRTLLSTLQKTEGAHKEARIRHALCMFARVCMPQYVPAASGKKQKDFVAELVRALNASGDTQALLANHDQKVDACSSMVQAPSDFVWIDAWPSVVHVPCDLYWAASSGYVQLSDTAWRE